MVVAVTGAAVGFAFDAGSGKELTSVFSGLYVVGCLAAVLAVRQSGVFTAVIQPPLILFCAVPGAYFLFHGAKFTGIKDLLINCGYPLIERFPLMLFTSAAVLLIGLVRWYLSLAVRRSIANAEDDTDGSTADAERTGAAAHLVAKLTSLLHRESTDDEAADKPVRSRAPRTHAVERSARTTAARKSGGRPAASRTRRPRPPLDEAPDAARRPRRPTRDVDGSEPPRRGRLPRDLEQRGRPPWEVRGDTQARRGRPASRISRFEPREPAEPRDSAPPPRRRPAPNGSSRQTATHHPISQVRYRNDESHDQPASRSRRPRKAVGENWDYEG